MIDPDDIALAVGRLMDSRGYIFETGITGLETIPSWRVVQPDMLLPVFLRLAEEQWRRSTGGAGFGLRFVSDEISLTGYRFAGLLHVPASIALLAVDAVLERLAVESVITVEALAHEALNVVGPSITAP